MQQPGMQITCPNCHQPFTAPVEQIIDVGRDPQGKARLLSGRTNLVTCPHCGYQSMLGTPLVYHDPSKQLLMVYVPLELGLPQREQERLIGSLTNAVINSLPQDQRKGYMLTPKTMLTLPSMIDTILEADGITKETLEGQREKMRLVETFLKSDPEKLPDLIRQHDSEIDNEFFSILTATAEAALSQGRRDLAEQTLALRDQIIEQSTAGQELLSRAGVQEAAIKEVTEALNNLGDNAGYDELVKLAIELGHDGAGQGKDGEDNKNFSDDKLQALVGLARPALDYQFFQTLSNRIDRAKGDDKQAMTAIRDRLVELTTMVDKQNEAVIRQATDTLRAIAGSPDLESAIKSRLELLDDTFLAVLQANIQAAEQAKDIATAAKLKSIFEKVVEILRQNAPPAIQYINDLMQMPNIEDAQTSLEQHAQEYGPELVHWMDVLSQDLAARGSSPTLDRLGKLRDEAVKALAVAGMGDEQS